MDYECIISYFFFITRQSACLLRNRDYAKGVNNMQLDCVFWLIKAIHSQAKQFKPIFRSLKNRQKKNHSKRSEGKSSTKFTFTKHFYSDLYHKFTHIQLLGANNRCYVCGFKEANAIFALVSKWANTPKMVRLSPLNPPVFSLHSWEYTTSITHEQQRLISLLSTIIAIYNLIRSVNYAM